MPDLYTCARCKGTFEKIVSDEEAMEEAKSLFSKEDLSEGVVIVCDNCYKELMAIIKQESIKYTT